MGVRRTGCFFFFCVVLFWCLELLFACIHFIPRGFVVVVMYNHDGETPRSEFRPSQAVRAPARRRGTQPPASSLPKF